MAIDHTEVRVRGRNRRVPCVTIDGKSVLTTGRWLKTATILEEELIEGETVPNAELFVSRLRESDLAADLFTFAQRLPDVTPRYKFAVQLEQVAAIPITSFSKWWKERTEYSIRKAVNRAKKLGVITKVSDFDDEFAAAISAIYGETPVRQGKAFWHYKKDPQTVKQELGNYLDRSTFIGAYWKGELIGSMKLTYVGSTATIMQILSAQEHFDKRPNNALIAKAVEICELHHRSHLIYGSFIYHDPNSTLTEFKRRHGFEPIPLPRYYVPLTATGTIALKLGLHRGLAGRMPKSVLTQLLRARSCWYAYKLKTARWLARQSDSRSEEPLTETVHE